MKEVRLQDLEVGDRFMWGGKAFTRQEIRTTLFSRIGVMSLSDDCDREIFELDTWVCIEQEASDEV